MAMEICRANPSTRLPCAKPKESRLAPRDQCELADDPRLCALPEKEVLGLPIARQLTFRLYSFFELSRIFGFFPEL